MQQRRHRRETEGRLVAIRGGSQPHDVQSEQPCGEDRETASSDVYERTQSTSRPNHKTKAKLFRPEFGPLTLTELLYKYPTCPPSAYLYIKEFFNNPNLNSICNNDKYAERDVRNWCSKINSWSFNDFKIDYEDPDVKPYFNAYNRLNSNVYYSVDESVKIANDLLLYQFSEISENVCDFLTDLFNVLDKRVP